jgi:hypothetical protein
MHAWLLPKSAAVVECPLSVSLRDKRIMMKTLLQKNIIVFIALLAVAATVDGNKNDGEKAAEAECN